LGENLAGWKGKLIGDHAGFGLGGWLKWMKNNPDAGLAEALETLPAFTFDGDTPAPPKPPFNSPVAYQPSINVKHPPSASPIIIAACLGLLLAVGGLAYHRMNSKAPAMPPLYAEQPLSPSAEDRIADLSQKIQPTPTPAADPNATVGKTEAPQHPSPQPSPIPTENTEAVSVSRVQEMAEKLAREKEAQRAAALAPPVVNAPPVRDFTPGDGNKMRELKANGHASVTGVLRNIRFSGSGQSMYFEFSSPLDGQEIRAVIHKKGLQGDFSDKAFADLIGKKLRFDGVVFREPNGRQYVKISARAKITEVK
jgi:hypothetical protein